MNRFGRWGYMIWGTRGTLTLAGGAQTRGVKAGHSVCTPKVGAAGDGGINGNGRGDGKEEGASAAHGHTGCVGAQRRGEVGGIEEEGLVLLPRIRWPGAADTAEWNRWRVMMQICLQRGMQVTQAIRKAA